MKKLKAEKGKTMKSSKPRVKKDTSATKKRIKRASRRISFLIILAFSVFVFYRGLIHIKLEEGEYAVIYTKTGGYEDEIIESGDFQWRWQNLFPTNLTLHKFQLPTKTKISVLEGYLPSGEIYGDFIDNENAFAYTIKFNYQYKVNKEGIIEKIYESGFSDDILKEIDIHEEAIIRRLVLDELEKPRESFKTSDLNAIEESIKSKFSSKEITLLNLTIYDLKLPDLNLYNSSAAEYILTMSAEKEIQKELTKEAQTLLANNSSKMDLFKQYGEVLSEYPILLEYLTLDEGKLDPTLFEQTP